MARKIKLIYNPASRGGKSKSIADSVQQYLDEMGVDYGYAETTSPLDGITQAQNAKHEGYDVVCSIGGDGTAHEVANGAIKSDLTFSLIPAGSGNDFAMGIGMSSDWEYAADVLVNGREESLSVVKVGDRYSINVVDVGLGGAVAEKSMRSLRWMGGSKKYTLLMFRTLLTHKPYPCTIRIDGEETDYDANMIVAGFGQTFGSGMRVLPDARYNRDKMEIAVIHSASKFTVVRIFPKVFSGTHVNYTKYVDMLRGKEMEIIPHQTNPRKMISEAEGELVGTAPMKFEAIPNGLNTIIPKDWSLDNPSLWAND